MMTTLVRFFRNRLTKIAFCSALCVSVSGCLTYIHTHPSRKPADTPVGRSIENGYPAAQFPTPIPTQPKVFVIDGQYLVVDQEPIRIFSSTVINGLATITWLLPDDQPYQFDSAEGVVIAGAPMGTECKTLGDKGRAFSCTYPFTPGSRFKYSVLIRQGDRPLQRLDPEIVNME